MTRRLDRLTDLLRRLGELTDPERFSLTELWLISFWSLLLLLLALFVLYRPDMSLPVRLP
ncbi:MAG: hypothetical protein EPN91_12110 [Salinibacterium sp.]|nr:MAG: hypothetical protein EPN91_12110 [Salinibacterium sp.]